MNRDRLLYETNNIKRNLNKVAFVIDDLEKLSENDGILENDVNAIIQVNGLMEELKGDIQNVRDSVDYLEEASEASLKTIGYVREHISYGKWIPEKDKEQ